MHSGLRDDLYGVPGEWRLLRCEGAGACGLVWLDPLPDAGAFAALYRSYYTHGADAPAAAVAGPNRLWLALAKPYQALLRRTPIAKMREDREAMWLNGRAPGMLLDVGCGDGAWLARMREAGWQVRGQELDARAADVARGTYGLDVFAGELSEARFGEATFDAVTMSHVIEHAFDPLGLLGECRRILKPGGTFVATTPNYDSLSRRRFNDRWRGLEPPRHIQIYSPNALGRVLREAGFRAVHISTTPVRAQFMYIASRELEHWRHVHANAKPGMAELARGVIFELEAWREFGRDPSSGEEVVAIAEHN